MEPVTIIVAALVAGAVSGFKKIGEQTVADAYENLKQLIQARYHRVGVGTLENDPESESRQEILQQDLMTTGANKDHELLAQAGALLEAIREHDSETARNITVSLRDGDIARDVDIDTLIAEAGSINVNAEGAKVGGSFRVKNLRTGGGDSGNR